MKKLVQLLALMLAALFILTGCNTTANNPAEDTTTADPTVGDTTPNVTTPSADEPDDPEEDTRWGSAHNIDGDALYYFLNTRKYWVDGEWSIDNLEENLIDYFENHYTDCGISDILYNISMSAPFASDDPDLYDKIDKYYTTEENGVPVDYTQEESVIPTQLIYENTDVDPYQVWFDQCRQNGINPWLSFRMNDVHYANEKTGHSPFGYKARENGWLIGNERSSYWENNECTQGSRFWYAYALDYSVPEVRERFLKDIDDRMSVYEPYGIELDWHRQIWCFETDDVENCKYMNEFMEDVNEIVEKYEGIYGHDIKIAVRINRDIDENKYFGFDVRYWGSTDSDMPIAEWVEELKGENIDVWAGLECHVMTNAYWHSIPTLSAYTAQYLSQGAAKIYTYNLFNAEKAIFAACESLEKALKAQKRSYIVTESNCTPYNVPGITEWDPLPIRLQVNESNTDIVINHGTLNYTKDTVIYVALAGVATANIDESTLVVKYNGTECTYDGVSKKSYLKEKQDLGVVIAFKVPKDAVNNSIKGELTFDAGINVTITLRASGFD